MQGVILKREKESGSYAGLILGDDGVRYPFTSHSWRSDDVEPAVGMRVEFEVRDFEGRGTLATDVRVADETSEVSRDPAKRPADSTPAPQTPTPAAPPTMQEPPSREPHENIGPGIYQDSPAAYESTGLAQARQTQRSSLREIPTTLMVALAVVPAVLLLLTLLPITPWYSIDRGSWGGEYSTEYESLWDTFAVIRDYRLTWEGTFGAYLFAIVGAVALAIAMFMYRQSNERSLHTGEGDESYDDRLDLFLSVSIFISAFTVLSALFAWYFIRLGPLLFRIDYSLGPLLWGLAILGIFGYLASLVANETIRSRFRHISVSTFVSFKGRIRRPTFALISTPMHVQNLVSILATFYVLGAFAPSPLDGYLLAPYGILIDTAEQHPTALLSWILPTSGLVLILQIAIFYLWLAACAKRFHDLDKSGWWTLVSFIPIVGPIWIFVELGLKRGTPGDNRFGPPQEQVGTDAEPGVVSGREANLNQGARPTKDCPYCAELIPYEAVICRFCGSNIPTTQEATETQPARRTKTCPYCAETIMFEALKCRYCGSEVPNATPK